MGRSYIYGSYRSYKKESVGYHRLDGPAVEYTSGSVFALQTQDSCSFKEHETVIFGI